METPKISKTIKKGIWNSQKKVYYISKIADNRATIIVYKATAYEGIDQGTVVISVEYVMGESITLKVSKDIIDKVIDSYGDIVAKIYHNEGILTGIQTFDEFEEMELEKAEEGADDDK